MLTQYNMALVPANACAPLASAFHLSKKHGEIENKVDLNKGDFRNETL